MTTLAPVGAQPRTNVSNALPGVVAGTVAIGGIAAGLTRASIPLPIGLALGAAVGGPIIGVSLMNNLGEPNDMWKSLAVGAAPAAVIGGALGWLGAGLSGMGPKPVGLTAGIITGAVMLGAVGAGIGALAHVATKPD